MRPLGQTVVRWPGGCFANSYNWRDGIGPRGSRPRKPNFWTDSGRLRELRQSSTAKNDPNQFGTNEFMRFCRSVNAEPSFGCEFA